MEQRLEPRPPATGFPSRPKCPASELDQQQNTTSGLHDHEAQPTAQPNFRVQPASLPTHTAVCSPAEPESSQPPHMVGDHSLRLHHTRSNCRKKPIARADQGIQPGAPLCQKQSRGPHLTRGDCRAQLVASPDHGAQPAALPDQRARWSC